MSIKFTGFAEGETVTIDGVTAPAWGARDIPPPDIPPPSGNTVWDVAPTAGTSVTINMSRSDYQVAPDLVYFTLDVSGFDNNTPADPTAEDNAFKTHNVFWDFGESYEFTAPTKVLEMDAADGGDRAQARYQMGGHGHFVYRSPGSKTVRVSVWEASSGKVGYAEVTFNVVDPATLFPNTQTIYVHPSNGGNSPTGARRETSLDAALAVVKSASVPTRVMLAQGQTFSMSNFNYQPAAGPRDVGVFIVAENGASTANRPIVNKSGTTGDFIRDQGRRLNTRDNTGFILQGIDFRHTYDPVTNTGDNSGAWMNCTGGRGSDTIVVDDCTIRGFWAGIGNTEYNLTTTPNFCLNNTAIDGWGNIGMIGYEGVRVLMSGSRVAQDSKAQTDVSRNTTLGPLRLGNCAAFRLISTYMFSQSGYNVGGRAANSSIQPSIRILDGGYNHHGVRLYMGDSYFCSPRNPVRMECNTDKVKYPVNALFEHNMIVGGYQASMCIQMAYGGVEIRNNHIQHGAETRKATPTGFIATANENLNDPSNNVYAIRIYNNTFVNTTNTSLTTVLNDLGGNLNFDINNNVIHQPFGSYQPDAPMEIVGNVNPPEMNYTLIGTPPENRWDMDDDEGNLYRVGSGSPAYRDSDVAEDVAGLSFTRNFTDTPFIAAADRNRGAV